MLSPAERALVGSDQALPGLPVLLDDGATTEWLRGTGVPVLSVRRRYVRYKPGTSCVVAAELQTPDGLSGCFLTAHDALGADKVAKSVAKAPPGSVLAVDPRRRLLAATAAADRDLPALAVLAHPRRRRRLLRRLLPQWSGRGEVSLEPLRHKPQRRWVGRLRAGEHPLAVLRAYRPEDAAAAERAGRVLSGGTPPTPGVLGADSSLGVTAVTYLPGEPLDAALRAGGAGAEELRAAGAALADLHRRQAAGLPARPGAGEAEAVRAAALQVAGLLPALAGRALGLAETLAGRLAASHPEAVALHGDFSADQVVLGAAGPALIDLDSACLGDPALDLGSVTAGLALGAALTPGERVPQQLWLSCLTAGYAARRPLPDPERVALHTAALLLRRAPEPFRLCAPAWPDATERLLAQAERVAAGAEARP